METPRRDWSDGPPDDEDYGYTLLHHDVADASLKALKALAAGPAKLVEHQDVSPWSVPEGKFLVALRDLDFLSGTMVPPNTTPLDNRRRADDLLHDLGNALPYADSERRWLLNTGLHATNLSPSKLHADQPGFLDSVAEEKATLVVEGVTRPVSGRSLLERQWMWRREIGIYAGGEGLTQAKVALAGLVNLLRPTLEEPEELARLSGQNAPS